MNSLFISNLVNLPTQLTGASILFKQATFYGISGFNPSGVPTYNANNIYIGTQSGFQPIMVKGAGAAILGTGIPIGTGVTISAYYQLDGYENLNRYFVSPQNTGDGCFVIYA